MKTGSLILTALAFLLSHGWSSAHAEPTTSAVAHSRSLAWAQGVGAPAGFRTDFMVVPARLNEASGRHLPVFYFEETPFATQARVPVAHLWQGRLHLEAFYQEIYITNLVRGVAQSNDYPALISGGQSWPPARSYGIRLSFAFSDHRPKER